jgi:vitamin B12 transporter
LKQRLIYIALAFSAQLIGQPISQKDTVRIPEVVISVRKVFTMSDAYKKAYVDSSLIRTNSQRMLGDILSGSPSLYIKSYGPGGSSAPSFRGTGAGHTRISWNGIDINNSMLGQSDLSLIPAGFADNIEVSYGAASMDQASGGIGGAINLENTPIWKPASTVSVSAGAGSFGQYTAEGKISAGSKSFQSVSRFLYNSAENDFPYLNSVSGSEPVWETRQNSQIKQTGFEQELYYRNAGHSLTGRLWYQSADRNLPGSILVQPHNSGEKQFDESLRTMLDYTLDKGANTFFFTAAFISNQLDYTNQIASIDSKNLSQTGVIKTGAGIKAGRRTNINFLLNEELDIVKSNNYETKETRYTTSLTASAASEINQRIDLSFLIRQIVTDKQALIPDFSGAVRYKLFEGRDFFLKGNISRNSKIPTMNDLFWMPGGNRDLKNEYAYMYELLFEMRHKFEPYFNIDWDVAVFSNRIKDMIQWLPGEYSYWSPSNIRNVNTQGVETSASLGYSSGNLRASLNLGYSFISAENASQSVYELSDGKQLIYIPENQASSLLVMKFHNFYSSLKSSYVGKRFTSADNSKYLHSYLLNDLTAGSFVTISQISFDLSLSVNNIFNTEYQSLAYYPMPGRSFFLKISFNFKKP